MIYMKKTIIFSAAVLAAVIAVSAFAQTTPSAAGTSSANAISCVKAAIVIREAALSAAIGSYTQALSSAYGTRSSALQMAYNNTDAKQVRTGIKSTWTVFKTATKNATKAWRATRTSAWTAYKKAAKACKAPSSINDSGNAGLEVAGQ